MNFFVPTLRLAALVFLALALPTAEAQCNPPCTGGTVCCFELRHGRSAKFSSSRPESLVESPRPSRRLDKKSITLSNVGISDADLVAKIFRSVGINLLFPIFRPCMESIPLRDTVLSPGRILPSINSTDNNSAASQENRRGTLWAQPHIIGRVLNPELQMLLKLPKFAHIPAPFHAHLANPGTFKWPNSSDPLLIAHIESIVLGEELGSSPNFYSGDGRGDSSFKVGGFICKTRPKSVALFGTKP
ncbi:hypothetical protein B0H19DRAFT_1085965 [Mycena capillaripes]|nr:hypothetical protein B0H19DRAFT_1085965 [Mycena capillaripes]